MSGRLYHVSGRGSCVRGAVYCLLSGCGAPCYGAWLRGALLRVAGHPELVSCVDVLGYCMCYPLALAQDARAGHLVGAALGLIEEQPR